MTPISVVGFFCEDIREEIGGNRYVLVAETIVGDQKYVAATLRFTTEEERLAEEYDDETAKIEILPTASPPPS